MRKEIGSEFWDVPLSNKENGIFSENVAWFLSGRSALCAIIADAKNKRNVKKVYLPSWCCDSMILPFLKNGIEVKFYPVYFDAGKLIQEIPEVEEDEMILVLDYFGYSLGSEKVKGEGVVIRDVTHSVFSKSYNDADYYFGSLRKWCGFLTGGFAVGVSSPILEADECYINMRRQAMKEKAEYICGESDNKGYLSVYAAAEDLLDKYTVSGADKNDILLASKVDVSFLKERRRSNASLLLEAFSDVAVFNSLGDDDCPLFVPIVLPEGERDELRRFLISHKIYCPVHWPISELHVLDQKTDSVYKRELSLVCDQRYDIEDMSRIIETVNEFYKR